MVTADTPPLLDVRGLGIFFRIGAGEVQATRDVSFQLKAGERLGIVGESGCGKTVTGLSILGLLPRAQSRVVGEVRFEGRDLLTISPRQMRQVRGRQISMIFQEPMSALDPVFTVGEQIAETLRAHRGMGKKEARERAVDALAQVGIPLPSRRVDEYPHQLSGGMRQRAMIAIALSCEPQILIADEPTTALDVTIQAQIIDLLFDLSARTGTALIFITHDLGVIAETCTRMLTMYAGEVVEDAPVDLGVGAAAPSLYVGPATLDPAAQPAQVGAAVDSRARAVAGRHAGRLSLPAALRARARRVRGDAGAARCVGRSPRALRQAG